MSDDEQSRATFDLPWMPFPDGGGIVGLFAMLVINALLLLAIALPVFAFRRVRRERSIRRNRG